MRDGEREKERVLEAIGRDATASAIDSIVSTLKQRITICSLSSGKIPIYLSPRVPN